MILDGRYETADTPEHRDRVGPMRYQPTMMDDGTMLKRSDTRAVIYAAFAVMIAAALSSCGSTKVISAEKSLVYRGTLYSLAGVSSVSSKIEATIPGGEVIDVRGFERDEINDLLEAHESVALRSAILLDGREILYEQRAVDSYRDFRKLQRDIEDAMEDIVDFMADADETQLSL